MLESVDDKAGQGVALQDLIVIDLDLFNSVQALDLAHQNERAQVVVT